MRGMKLKGFQVSSQADREDIETAEVVNILSIHVFYVRWNIV